MTHKKKQKKSAQREILEWGILLGIVLLIYTTGFHHTLRGWILATGLMNSNVEQAAEAQTDASYNLPLASLDGKSIDLADYKGKVVFINFWATWCPPCIAEMPNIHRLYEQVGSEDIVFLMVSMDENPQRVKKFLERKDYNFPVYFPTQGLPAEFRHNSIPRTYVISPKGKIVTEQIGMANYDNSKFRNFLTSLGKTP